MRSHHTRRRVAVSAVLLLISATPGEAWPFAGQRPAAPSADRPNILLMVSDDQTWTNFTRDLMPNTFAELVDKGVTFDRGYVASSECCPARAEILTGLYEHHTGVDQTDSPFDRPTIVDALHAQGYRSGLFGKYLNSWPCTPRSEFDQWVCAAGGLSSYTLLNPTLNVNGAWTKFSGYTTDILANETVSFIQSTPSDQPFFAMYTPPSPHLPADDPRCLGIAVDPYRPPAYDEDTTAGAKPQSTPAITRSRPSTLVYRRMRSATASGCSTTFVE